MLGSNMDRNVCIHLGVVGTIVPVVADIGEQIQAARGRANMSQVALAKAVGVVKNTVSNWENGLSKPSDATLARLRAVLHETWDDPGQPDATARTAEDDILRAVRFDKLMREVERRHYDALDAARPDRPGRPGKAPPEEWPETGNDPATGHDLESEG